MSESVSNESHSLRKEFVTEHDDFVTYNSLHHADCFSIKTFYHLTLSAHFSMYLNIQRPVGVVAERSATWVTCSDREIAAWSGVRILPRGTSFQPIIRLRARLNEAVVGGLHRHPAPGIGADGLAHWSTRLPNN